MIVYFDTSAIIPLIVNEPGSPVCERFWNDATQAVSSRLLYVEARAALARAHLLGRLSRGDLASCVESLNGIISQIASVEVTEDLVRTAGRLAEEEGLRGYGRRSSRSSAGCHRHRHGAHEWRPEPPSTAATRVGLAVAPTS